MSKEEASDGLDGFLVVVRSGARQRAVKVAGPYVTRSAAKTASIELLRQDSRTSFGVYIERTPLVECLNPERPPVAADASSVRDVIDEPVHTLEQLHEEALARGWRREPSGKWIGADRLWVLPARSGEWGAWSTQYSTLADERAALAYALGLA